MRFQPNPVLHDCAHKVSVNFHSSHKNPTRDNDFETRIVFCGRHALFRENRSSLLRNMGFGSRISRDLEYTERMRPSESLKTRGYKSGSHQSHINQKSLNRRNMQISDVL